LGRAAAKEAVRRLVASSGGDAPLHADVKVESDASGRPVVAAATVLPAPAPRISIAHVDDRAYAVAVSGTAGVDVGVDVEPLRDLGADWEAEAFADDERSRIAAAGQRTPGPWALRAWCAKEAVAKALGTGLKGHPRSLRITEIGANGRIRVTRNDKGTTHTAQTFNHDGLVAAIAFHRPLATNPSEERTSP
jgi:phosphopantetheinyl transferase